MEIWKDIEGYNGKYQISNLGNVRSFSRWKKGGLLKFGKCGNPGPYKTVFLVKTCRKDTKCFYVHRLVAAHFLENPNNYPEVNHIDGDTTNNCVSNLEWCTRQYNASHASKIGVLSKAHDFEKGKKNPKSKAVIQMDKDGNVIKEWESVNQVTRITGIPACDIFKCCNPKKYPTAKTAYGYRWKYKHGETNNKENS